VAHALTYHEARFPFDSRRELVWRTLCEAFFNRLVEPEFHVLELGAGYGHFINNIQCKNKTAVDQWPGMLQYVRPEVTPHLGSVTNLDFLPDRSIDFAFASNLFEHLTQAEFAATLAELRRTLKPSGSLNILQPNYRLAYREYFDDYTHCSVYSDLSLCDFVSTHGFQVTESVPGFLPLSLKSSRSPVRPWLIKMYLASPWKPLARQMFVRARIAPAA